MALYRKNIGGGQQIARLAMGGAAAAASLVFLASPLNLVGAAAGLIFAITGLVGYCPMCAIADSGARKRAER
ncbi:DUF2892 domain-containing protein [Terrarubrum flagellatum]|uniref:YgaP family membrane protein n=1 Tax=Terrirubrum flagellatum TaxID=2895980 RepID=UPI003144E19F